MASLVYHAGALGDFITTLPALRAWRRLHPQERITLLGKPGYASVAGRHASWDEVWNVESARFAHLFAPALRDSASASPVATAHATGQIPLEDFTRFSSALLFSPPSSPLRANLEALGIPGILCQAPFPASTIPVIDYHLSLFPLLELSPEERIPLIDTGAAAPPSGRDEEWPTVALHSGSGSETKNWPLERFEALAAALEGLGERVVWIAGPAERDLTPRSGARVWRNLPLASLSAGLSRCRLFVGNDSGVTHLAAAAGVPTLALFGASDPAVWAPRGRRVRLLEGASLTAIRVGAVLQGCKLLLAE